jgi:prephenate dehydrogenase
VKVAVLGVGLIGGSIGLAARRRAGAHVVGYDPDAGVLSSAVELEAIDEPAFEISEAVTDAELVFVATPVGVTTRMTELALQGAGPQCVVSDVGSTKHEIAAAIADPRFVGGHPLAGAETAGVENARIDLFDGATWYLTPGADVPVAGLERLRELIGKLGARPVEIDAHDHDRLMASVSHLPHVLANVLVAQAGRIAHQSRESLRSSDVQDQEQSSRLSVGPSFRDATRVAGANQAIWPDIYLSNRDALIEAIEAAIVELEQIRSALGEGDAEALTAWHALAFATREELKRAGLVPGP